MSHEASFVLPLPPSINESYATVQGRRVASRALRSFKHDTRYILVEQGVLSPLWKQAKYLGYEATFYTRTRGSDVDGRIKGLQDGVTEALGVNDNRVYEIHIFKRIDRQTPRVQVRLFTLEEAQVA